MESVYLSFSSCGRCLQAGGKNYNHLVECYDKLHVYFSHITFDDIVKVYNGVDGEASDYEQICWYLTKSSYRQVYNLLYRKCAVACHAADKPFTFDRFERAVSSVREQKLLSLPGIADAFEWVVHLEIRVED
jgi:hypothetical protein